MPGRWIRDDSESLYYLDDEDDVTAISEDVAHVVNLGANAQAQDLRKHGDAQRSPLRHEVAAALRTVPHVSTRARKYRDYGSNSTHRTAPDERQHHYALQNSILKRKRPSASFVDAITLDPTFTHPLFALNLVMGYNTSLPKSRLDVYITALRQLIRCCSESYALSSKLQRAVTAEGVLWVVREAWPAAEGYWNLTATFRGFLQAELWRNFPCEQSYRQLPPAYRPTRAQLAVPHSPMIDWLPWPDVRDMAIKFQDQIDVDDLFRLAIHNLVAHRRGMGRRKRSFREDVLSSPKLIEEVTDETSFRVWDLVCLEKAKSTNPLSAEPGLEMRPELRTPELRALSRAYDLEFDEFDTQKLDDGFFEAFPCLYADTAASGWKVRSFPSLNQVDVGRPVDLSALAVFRLKSRIETLVGGKIEL